MGEVDGTTGAPVDGPATDSAPVDPAPTVDPAAEVPVVAASLEAPPVDAADGPVSAPDPAPVDPATLDATLAAVDAPSSIDAPERSLDPAADAAAATVLEPLTDASPPFVIVVEPEVFAGDPPPIGVSFQVVVRDNAYAVLRINDAEYRLASSDLGSLRRAFDAAFMQLN